MMEAPMVETTTVGEFKNQTTGATYTVVRDTRMTTFRPVSGPASKMKGSRSYRTSSGIALNAISDDESKFETLNDETLIRIA
jgi:hypothetical protein